MDVHLSILCKISYKEILNVFTFNCCNSIVTDGCCSLVSPCFSSHNNSDPIGIEEGAIEALF